MESYDKIVDQIEGEIVKIGAPVDLPLKHLFTNGIYTRQIFIPAGTTLTSKIHKTEHPFVVMVGRINVITDGEIEQIAAPYLGVTKPNTRRVLHALEDTVWITFHPTKIKPNDDSDAEIKNALRKIENKIIKKRVNRYLK